MKRIILWSAVCLVILGVAVAGVWWMNRPKVIVFNGGTTLTLLGVEYGKHHKYPAIKVKSGTRQNYGRPTSFETPEDTMVVWVLVKHNSRQGPNFQTLAYDRAGTACVGSWGGGFMNQISSTLDVMGVQIAAFPRRDREFYLRFSSWGRSGQVAAKQQWVIANPLHSRSFAQWTPEALPDTQSDGDLNVTLTKLDYGVPGFNSGSRSSKDPMNEAVLAAFHTEQKGVIVTNWEPVQIEMSDATGNHVQNSSWSNSRDDNGDATMTYQWGLWPGEPWKLRVEMSRTAGFQDNELWTVENIPVQPGSQMDLWNYGGQRQTNKPFAETTLNGVHLKLYPAIRFTDQNFNGQKPGGFRVVADPPPDGYRMTLVKMTDEHGRVIQNWSPSWGGGNYSFQLQDLRNAGTLNVTLALHQSRFAEFTVKPGLASSADISH